MNGVEILLNDNYNGITVIVVTAYTCNQIIIITLDRQSFSPKLTCTVSVALLAISFLTYRTLLQPNIGILIPTVVSIQPIITLDSQSFSPKLTCTVISVPLLAISVLTYRTYYNQISGF